jgi:chromate transporter
MNDDLTRFALFLSSVSIVAFGGAASIYAPIQHQSVEVQHILTAREFLDFFAVSRAAPGPSSMIGTLIGWKIAGVLGAAVVTLSFYAPVSLLVFAAGTVWNRHRGKRWHTALQTGLAPVGGGLILAGALTLAHSLADNATTIAIAVVAAVLMAWKPKLHPFLYLVCGGVISYALFRLA